MGRLPFHALTTALDGSQPGRVQARRRATRLAAAGGVQRFDRLVGEQQLDRLAGVRPPVGLRHQPLLHEFGQGGARGFALAAWRASAKPRALPWLSSCRSG